MCQVALYFLRVPGRTLYHSSLVQVPPLNEQPPPRKNGEQAHGKNYRKRGLPQHALLFIFSTPSVPKYKSFLLATPKTRIFFISSEPHMS